MIGLSLSSDNLVSGLIQPMLKDEITYRKAEFDPEYHLFGFLFNPDSSVRQNSKRETNCLAVGPVRALHKLDLQLIADDS